MNISRDYRSCLLVTKLPCNIFLCLIPFMSFCFIAKPDAQHNMIFLNTCLTLHALSVAKQNTHIRKQNTDLFIRIKQNSLSLLLSVSSVLYLAELKCLVIKAFF